MAVPTGGDGCQHPRKLWYAPPLGLPCSPQDDRAGDSGVGWGELGPHPCTATWTWILFADLDRRAQYPAATHCGVPIAGGATLSSTASTALDATELTLLAPGGDFEGLHGVYGVDPVPGPFDHKLWNGPKKLWNCAQKVAELSKKLRNCPKRCGMVPKSCGVVPTKLWNGPKKLWNGAQKVVEWCLGSPIPELVDAG